MLTPEEKIRLDILNLSYFEHYKHARELLTLSYPIEHKKRQEVEKALNEIQEEMNILKAKIEK